MRPLKSIWWMDLKLVCGGDNEVWFNNMVEWRFGNGHGVYGGKATKGKG